jgi:hypothetical protein
MKPAIGRNVTLALLGAHASPIYRDCRVPTIGSGIFAQFDKSNVKLFMQELSIDGTGKGYSETYKIRGILEPAPVPAAPVTALTMPPAVVPPPAPATETPSPQ